jgi:uncharacterized protein (DUF849 family)
LLHGENAKAWELVKVPVARGYDTRIGFEDVLTLPDGTYADRNALLIANAFKIADRWLKDPTLCNLQGLGIYQF